MPGKEVSAQANGINKEKKELLLSTQGANMNRVGRRLTVALSAWMLWLRGKPIEVRMAMLSSGGELPSGVAPMGLSLVEGPGSIMEGRVRGSAKSGKYERDSKNDLLSLSVYF